MASGVAVRDECVTIFEELKLRHKFRYIVYKLSSNNEEIVVETKMAKEDEDANEAPRDRYAKFKEELTKTGADNTKQCRYAVYDVQYLRADGQQQDKVVFIVWCPDEAKIKQKMMYASSKDALKKKLLGIKIEIQANDEAEASWDAIMEKLVGHK